MLTGSSEVLQVRSSSDIVKVRQEVRSKAAWLGMSLVDQTKIVTAASEIARNIYEYGGGGQVTIDIVRAGPRRGVRLLFQDQGPGIPDIDQAMRDGFTTGRGLGLGLGGAKRLVNEFEIESEAGRGTSITLIRWKT